VGAAVALALARREIATVLVEAEPELALAASGTNSGILHSGFDSTPGELETRLLLLSAELRPAVLERLGVPVRRCGATMRAAPDHVAQRAADNGVPVRRRGDGTLEVPGEWVTDPVAYTIALASAANASGADVRCGFRLAAVEDGPVLRDDGGEALPCDVAVNCAGLYADDVARLFGDESFAISPRKGEFLVFDAPLDTILLPMPTSRTKGVLVFPTLDGRCVAGPTAVDLEDKSDWSVRPEAAAEITDKAAAMHPPLEGLEPISSYAGLRPAGRGANYVIGHSAAHPALVNVAAIRSTGLSASLGIAEHVAELVAPGAVEGPLVAGTPAPATGPWWERTAAFRARP